MHTITGGGAFTRQNIADINANFAQLFAALTPGRIIYCNPATDYTGTPDGSVSKPFQDLPTAYSYTRNGKNDLVLLVGDGSTGATARLSSKLTWSNNAAHLIGITAPGYNRRARLAPPTSATAFADFLEVSGSGCYFHNFSIFHGFSTGTTAQIALTVSGSRNYFGDLDIFGMGDQESADDAGSRDILLEGSENVFERCNIGLDTVTRGAANASVQFSTTSCKRNTFVDCLFPFMCDAATPLGIIVDGAGESDRWQRFLRCSFVNAIGSTSSTMTALATLAASIGGLILLEDCKRLGITNWGTDATSLAQMYVSGVGAGTALGHTGGEAVVAATSD